MFFFTSYIYKTFFDSVKIYAESLYYNLHQKDLNVGITITYHGLTDPTTREAMKILNQSTDIISVTYYGINSDFTVKQPTEIISDFNQLLAIYSDSTQPIYFVECGYPSSSVCNSSEILQKEFIEKVFTAWDSNIPQIKYIAFFKLRA